MIKISCRSITILRRYTILRKFRCTWKCLRKGAALRKKMAAEMCKEESVFEEENDSENVCKRKEKCPCWFHYKYALYALQLAVKVFFQQSKIEIVNCVRKYEKKNIRDTEIIIFIVIIFSILLITYCFSWYYS